MVLEKDPQMASLEEHQIGCLGWIGGIALTKAFIQFLHFHAYGVMVS